jgi:hypothetical protein
MKIIALFIVMTTVMSSAWASNLTSTYINKMVDPDKQQLEITITKLQEAVKTHQPTKSETLIAQARVLLQKKSIQQKFNAAIVVTEESHDGDKDVNLIDYQDYLESAKSICYNGNIKTALTVANLLKDQIWIYDEFVLEDIIIDGKSIVFKVLDLFSFEDQGADESEKEDFLQDYIANACK